MKEKEVTEFDHEKLNLKLQDAVREVFKYPGLQHLDKSELVRLLSECAGSNYKLRDVAAKIINFKLADKQITSNSKTETMPTTDDSHKGMVEILRIGVSDFETKEQQLLDDEDAEAKVEKILEEMSPKPKKMKSFDDAMLPIDNLLQMDEENNDKEPNEEKEQVAPQKQPTTWEKITAKLTEYTITVLEFITMLTNLASEWLETQINIAFDIDDTMLKKRQLKGTETKLQEKWYAFYDKWIEFGVILYNVYLSNTDMLCYAVFILNNIVNPNILNTFFTVSAFGYAAVQYPVPHKVCNNYFLTKL